MARVIGRLLVVASLMWAGSAAFAQVAVPAEFQLVQDAVEALNQRDVERAAGYFASDGLTALYWLHWGRVHRGIEEIRSNLEEIAALGERWHVELVAVYGGGRTVVTRTESSIDGGLFRGTTLWVVSGGLIVGAITAWDADVLEAGERWVRLDGTWRTGLGGDVEYLRLRRSRASYAFAGSLAELTDATADEGTYLESGGVLTLSSGRVPGLCQPGDMLRVSVRFTDDDTFEAVLVEEACAERWTVADAVRLERVVDE